MKGGGRERFKSKESERAANAGKVTVQPWPAWMFSLGRLLLLYQSTSLSTSLSVYQSITLPTYQPAYAWSKHTPSLTYPLRAWRVTYQDAFRCISTPDPPIIFQYQPRCSRWFSIAHFRFPKENN